MPPSPDLSFEKKQAKALLRACRAGDAAARAGVRAGADRETSINSIGEPLETLASRAVAAQLAARGFAPSTKGT